MGSPADLVGSNLVDFKLQALDGSDAGLLSDHVGKGKKVVLDFYTSW